jgi:hypothetical protein
MIQRARRLARTPSPELVDILQWTARIGAVTAEGLAHLKGIGVASARGRLSVATHERLLARHRLLADRPALYTVTRAGLRATGLTGLETCRISAANSLHTIACSHAAAELQGRYPDQRVVGERELRREERRLGAPMASAILRHGDAHRATLHRPDLVLWPASGEHEKPVAVEVELTIKAPRRLEEICRAWARSRDVSGVLYLAPPAVERAVCRAVDKVQGADRVLVLSLDALPLAAAVAFPNAKGIPS